MRHGEGGLVAFRSGDLGVPRCKGGVWDVSAVGYPGWRAGAERERTR